jgi:DNA-binding NarL/FixJ family response regulator
MKILLADDHKVVRRGLRDILACEYPGARFTEVGNGDEVLSSIRDADHHLLVLDVNMPGRTGLDVLREVKQLRPRMPVLILSVHPEDQYAVRCLKAGASGYLTKDSSEEELVRAVRKLLSGGHYVSARLSEKLAGDLLQPPVENPHELLSDRELEVVRMIASGVTLTEIADALHVSVKTISTYRTRALLKMQIESNAELIRYSLEHEIVP